MRSIGQKLGFAALLIAGACQAPEQYQWDLPDAGGGIDGPAATGRGGGGPGAGGSVIGTGGMPTGFGGTTGAAGNAGTAGTVGTTGAAGTGGSPAGTGGMTTGAAGTMVTGTGGGAVGRGGTTGAAGITGAAGNASTAGTTGTGGTVTGRGGTGGGRGGTTGAAGNAGTAGTTGTGGTATGRGGTTGTGGSTGTGGGTGTVVYTEDFESEAVGATTVSGWSRAGGSSDDWTIATDGTKVLQQAKSTSSTIRVQSVSGSSWSGAASASARVKLLDTGSNGQAALLCVRYNDTSNRYCGALVPGGVQIQTAANGTSGSGAIISASVSVGTFYDLRISVDASNVLTLYLGGTLRGTYTPLPIASGTVALGTTSAQAAFDNITVTRP